MLGVLAGLLGLMSGAGGGGAVEPVPLAELLEPARNGDRRARDQLIGQYMPLVLRIAAQVSGRYVQPGRDEEVSAGLLALNEAIDRYDPGHGAAFLTFAELVIRRRLVDHYRRRKRHTEVPLSSLEMPDGGETPLAAIEEREARARQVAEEEARERREEIARYSRRLLEFGIRFRDLVADAPRHEDARERAVACARAVAADPLLREHLLRRRELPLKALEGRVAVSRKTLERQRRYIVAVALLLTDPDYEHLHGYVAPYVASVER